MSWFFANDSDHYLSQGLENDIKQFLGENSTSFENESDFQFYFQKSLHWTTTLIVMHSVSFYVCAQGIFIVLILTLRQLGTEFQMDLEKTKDITGGIEKVRCNE